MPGVVSAHSHVGLSQQNREAGERPNRFRRGGRRRGGRGGGPASSGEDKTGERVIDQLYARQDVFGELLRDGVTTLGLAPLGRGLPGQGAVVRPFGEEAATMAIRDSAFIAIAPVADTKTKDLIRKAIEAGQRAAERRKRRSAPREEASEKANAEAGKEPATEPAGDKPADKPADGKPEGRPDAPPAKDGAPAAGGEGRPERAQEDDPAAEAMADLIEGKTRAFVQVESAMDLVHWEDVVADATFPQVFVCRRHATSGSEGSLDLVLDRLKKRKAPVLLAPEFATVPNTQYLTNLAARLHAAGIEVGFLLPDSGRGVSAARPQLMELVRAGLPAQVAIAGVTLAPAKALGIDDRVGSLAVGKQANLLLWTADPLDALAELRAVWLEGREVEDDGR
jgi:cytosine/adenosine deaminase-related metal-dependent hydrolase